MNAKAAPPKWAVYAICAVPPPTTSTPKEPITSIPTTNRPTTQAGMGITKKTRSVWRGKC